MGCSVGVEEMRNCSCSITQLVQVKRDKGNHKGEVSDRQVRFERRKERNEECL
jgi:hypothetical protein